jgi:DNA-directed RNA polymerase specialized sigma24 family protein
MLSDGNTLVDIDSLRPMPGQRPFTVAEYLGARRRNESRYGTWVLVLREHTEADTAFGEWCRRNCDHETTNGFRIRPDVWGEKCNETIPIAFLPEFDDPRPAVRELAASERHRRMYAAWLDSETDARDSALAAASERGLTRRQAADLLQLSVGRVQQLLERRRR